jgi:rRNA-processing protein EBP2
MARKGKLLAALDAHKGRDFDAEKRKKQVKAAEKRKRGKEHEAEQESDDKENQEVKEVEDDVVTAKASSTQPAVVAEFEQFEDEDEDEDEQAEEEEEDEENDSQASEVPLSEVSGSELEDTIPHQRLTINNGPALLASQSRISLLRKQPPKSKTPFYLHNSLISSLPALSTVVSDPNDDLTRELEFYRIARTAALSARSLLQSEKIPFSRPADYFAEMVKSDSHMDRIKNKLRDEAAEKKGREAARKQRDAKKFGKQVQIAKEQERAKTKRETLDKINDLKRSMSFALFNPPLTYATIPE